MQHLKELEYQDKLYCEITSSMLIRKTFKNFNGIRIELKSDGNNYVLGLFIKENLSFMLYKVNNKLGSYTR